MDFLNDILRQQTNDWTFVQLDQKQCPKGTVRRQLQADQDYFSIYLKSMRVVNVRVGVRKFYGMVSSYASVGHLSGKALEFSQATTPNQLKQLDSQHLDQVIGMNKPLIEAIPYRGGGIELETGLFTIEEDNLIQPYLSMLEKASGLAGVTYASVAMPYVKLIISGVNMLLSAGSKTNLEIGLSRTFEQPETGYFVVMRAEKNQVDAFSLSIDPKDYQIRDGSGALVRNYPYMVFSLSASPERDNWYEIPDISIAYRELMDSLRQGRADLSADQLAHFHRVVLTSPDLTDGDAERLTRKIDQKVELVLGTKKAAIDYSNLAERPGLPELSSIDLYSLDD